MRLALAFIVDGTTPLRTGAAEIFFDGKDSEPMAITLRRLAELVEAELHGDGDLLVHGASTLRDVQPGQITLLDKPKLAETLHECPAAAFVVPVGTKLDQPHLTVENVHRAFTKIVTEFRPPSKQTFSGISPDSSISPTAKLGEGATVYPYVFVGDNVEIGVGCTLHAGVRILAGCRIGDHVTIYPNAVLYEDTIVGDRVVLHAGAVLGACGFGYETIAGQHHLQAQLGGVEIGDDVEIGACTTIDRGAYSPTTIGAGTKIDNQVMIAHNCRIGRGNMICSQVGIAGSCSTGDYVVMGGQVGIGDHLDIGDQARVGAKSGVMTDIPSGKDVAGAPAMPLRQYFVMQAAMQRLPELRKQFRQLQDQVATLLEQAELSEKKAA